MKSEETSLLRLDPANLPVHVAMIMDGNGRWAKKRLMNRVRGHEQGAEAVRTMVRTTRELGIPYLTLYAFSTENWDRPKAEVSALMTLLKRFITAERQGMGETGIRLNAIGELDRLPEEVRIPLEEVMEETAGNDGMTLTLCLSYGSRAEIRFAMEAIAKEVAAGALVPEAITEEVISRHLYTRDLPDPDLLIRTSGEIRLSNFLLWQLAYAEMVFTTTCWPDFSEARYREILHDYQMRERRFGKLKA